MKNITVFCGSSLGAKEIFQTTAFDVGKTLANLNIGIIYGGARVGLMGALAEGCLQNDGKVTGVIPGFLMDKEIVHQKLTELIIVDTMHERKTKMNDLCDGIIALPGGFGTLEELFEMFTWAQLGLHKKPVAIMNIDGFYDPLNSLVKTMVDSGFLKEVNREMLIMSDNIEDILKQMESYVAPTVPKWITREST